MTRLRATFHYAVRGLTIRHDRLGASLPLTVLDHEVVVTLPLAGVEDEPILARPAPAFDERFPHREKVPPAVSGQDVFVTMSSSAASGPETQPQEIDLLRVEVFTEGEIAAADYGGEHGGTTHEVLDHARSVMEKAGKAADLTIERLLAWTRTRYGQSWLGLDGRHVERVGSEELVDLDAGRRLPWPARADFAFKVIDEDMVWSEESMRLLAELIQESPRTADLLLADARLLGGAMGEPDPPRAVLIAAIACEVKIKTTLQALATPEQLPLIDLLLENPRDWSVAASSLVNKPFEVVAGQGLKDADKDLHKEVIKVFERRNAFAHKGVIPTAEEARDAVSAARKLFAWLDELVPAGN